ncbi:MAG: hypothetical protein R3D25_21555 [Geminicoccaceae bacterium]
MQDPRPDRRRELDDVRRLFERRETLVEIARRERPRPPSGQPSSPSTRPRRCSIGGSGD